MKVREIYEHVAQLGFEDSLESANRFYYALNRSIVQINLLRPAISTVAINHSPLKNGITADTFEPITHLPFKDVIFSAEGACAYYFEAQGLGLCHVERQNKDGDWEEAAEAVNIPYSVSFKAFRGLIQPSSDDAGAEVRLRFEGEFKYTVRNVALYTETYTKSANDVPALARYCRYNVKDYAEDFLALDSSPIVESEGYAALTDNYEVEGTNTVLFPIEKAGCYLIRYRRQPLSVEAQAKPGDDETEIDLDEELCTLLPLLVSVYNLASDEPELANAYKTMYQERAAEILSAQRAHGNVKFINTNGWG